MALTDGTVIRFHLQVLHGITVRSSDKKKERVFIGGAKIFGVPLENLPRVYMSEFGLVPCFLVDACSFLLERVGTVGLFRKPGSLPRIKALRAKLNRGESCLSSAVPYDVATLVKQFCRELPEPLFPPELHGALLKAQSLSQGAERSSALQLLSRLLPARNFSCLHYLFNFLGQVAQRCTENLMTSSNIATVFVPCLLPPPNKTEMSESRLELRVLVLRTFIENPRLFGLIPKAVSDSMEFLRNFHLPKRADPKKTQRKRHSFKVLRSVKTMPWIQVRSKALSPVPEQNQESPPEGRPKLRRSLGLETFPNVQLFRTCLSCTAHSFTPGADCCSPNCKQAHEEGRRSRGPEAADGPVLTAMSKLQLTPWRRRSLP